MSTHPIEVFYSYADADEQLGLELDKHLGLLRREGVITAFHKRNITAGSDWMKVQDSHLNSAAVILLLISVDFVASDYCYGVEMSLALARHERGEARIIPVLLRPVDHWQGIRLGKLQWLPSNGKPVTRWPDREDAFVDVARGIRMALQDLQPYPASPSVALLPPIWNIPYSRNPFFTGQQEVLTRLANAFKKGQSAALTQPQAISGLGGIGKTQIAVEYAYQHRQEYQAVLWTLADTHESLVSGYIAIAQQLNLPEKREQDQTIIIQSVIRWLSSNAGWLLVLDNADELEVVREFIPTAFSGHILLTTRAQATGRLADRIEVGTMEWGIGALLLLRRASLVAKDAQLEAASFSDVMTAHEITLELGGLPLALDQAGA